LMNTEVSEQTLNADVTQFSGWPWLIQAIPFMHRKHLQALSSKTWDEWIRSALDQVSIEDPSWLQTAATLLLGRIYENLPAYGAQAFAPYVAQMIRLELYDTLLTTAYSPEELALAGSWIRPERDRLIPYSGLKTLVDRYLVRHLGVLMELPQHRFMVVALSLASAYGDERLTWAHQFYDALSQLELTVATPVLANAGRPKGQLASCFIDAVEDDLWSIYHTNQVFAQVSKWGGGMGIYLGHVRAKGSSIRQVENAAGGVVAWVKTFNTTATAVDQLGVRAGAVSVWLDIWHQDILDFLELRTNNGDPRMKAHDVFPGVSIPDAFMRAVETRAEWHLLDPHQVFTTMGWRLEDSFGEEWEARYQQLIADERIKKVTLLARDLMKLLMRSAYETGTPFVFFRDTVNRANPNAHQGMIYASNLCTEIAQNMRPSQRTTETLDLDGVVTTQIASGDFVVCNLASINLGRLPTARDRSRAARLAVRMMDAAVDLNRYPVKEAEYTARQYRAIGLGVSGYHHRLALDQIPWESEAHLLAADQWFEDIAYAAIDESSEIARVKGAYPYFSGSQWHTGEYFDQRGYKNPRWQQLRQKIKATGLRNGYLMAIAPTSSTSLIAGTSAGVDPIFSALFWEEKRMGMVPQVAPDLSPTTLPFYIGAHHLDPHWSIRAAAKRQRHLDQSQSLNLYITPNTSAADFLDYYLSAWREGIKTLYYVRSESLETIECLGCTN